MESKIIQTPIEPINWSKRQLLKSTNDEFIMIVLSDGRDDGEHFSGFVVYSYMKQDKQPNASLPLGYYYEQFLKEDFVLLNENESVVLKNNNK